VGTQKKELIDLLDQHVEKRMNAIVFQIRPGCDALYPSPFEPWSHWLSGTQGIPPDPYYDPLQMMVEECRKRNLELHAWFNPYRAVVNFEENSIASSHIAAQHPEWILTYGSNRYLNPGLQEVRDYVSNVVADVVRRYDIDAVHMDDYFYPYKIKDQEFPDELTFQEFPRGFEPDRKEDWRRDNVDLIIRQLQDTIRAIKPWVQFGISPFGVWRNKSRDPKGSETASSQTNYDDLYADILLWLREGWIDYVVPQAYWHIGFQIADHQKIAEWWDTNSYDRVLYIGNGVHRLNKKSDTPEWRSSKEIIRQIELDRALPHVSGNFYFNSKAFQRDPVNINRTLQKRIYPYPALIPVNPHLPAIIPDPPSGLQVEEKGKHILLSWNAGSTSHTSYFVIYSFKKGDPQDLDDPRNIYLISSRNKLMLKKRSALFRHARFFRITAVSRTHHESDPSTDIQIKY